MAKLEYTPIFTWQGFNYLGKRLFDFVNTRAKISTGVYIGNSSAMRNLVIDIIPKFIIIFTTSFNVMPVVWMEKFPVNVSKLIDGTNIVGGILRLSDNKQAFVVGNHVNVNDLGVDYSWIAFGD